MSKAQEITSQIWEMANRLRSNMDASEYRNYILGFMFYRYLSEHQEERMVQNDLLDIADGQSVNDAYSEQAGGDDLSDYLEELADSLGYAIAPHYTWQTIVDKVNNNSIAPSDFQDMLDDFNHNVDLNTNAKTRFSRRFCRYES
jgi:Type I restriction-modification system methyltransferase subunit